MFPDTVQSRVLVKRFYVQIGKDFVAAEAGDAALVGFFYGAESQKFDKALSVLQCVVSQE